MFNQNKIDDLICIVQKMTAKSKMEEDEMHWNDWLKKYELRIKKEMDVNADDLTSYNAERLKIMGQNNPR